MTAKGGLMTRAKTIEKLRGLASVSLLSQCYPEASARSLLGRNSLFCQENMVDLTGIEPVTS